MSNFTGFMNSVLMPLGGILIALLIIKRPYWGVVLLVGTLPLADSLPDVSGLTSIAIPIGALTVASFAIDRIINGKTISINPLSLAIYALSGLLAGLMMLGQWLNPATFAVRNFTVIYFQLTVFVILCDQLLRSEQKIQTLMLVYIVGAQITALLAINQFLAYTGGSVLLFRPSGDTGNANYLGVFLSLAIVMCVYFVQTTRNILLRFFIFFCIILSTIALILSGSRGAILFLIPVILYQLLRGGRRSVQLVILTVVVFALIAGFIPGGYWQRIVDIPNVILNQADTVGIRYSFWNLALKYWQSSPILGIGPGGFNLVSAESSAILFASTGAVPHNTYITVLTENGLVGITVFVTIFALTIYILFRLDRTYRRKNKNFTQLIITWQAVLAIMLLNAIKGDWQAHRMLWISVGIALAFYGGTQLPKQKNRPSPDSHL